MTRTVSLFLVAALALAGCSDSTDPGTGGTPAANQVFMQGSGFNPITRTITSGTNLTWVNKDGFTHNVQSSSVPGGATSFSSGAIGVNGTFQVTLTVPGTYEYFCSLHGTASTGMHATVTVN